MARKTITGTKHQLDYPITMSGYDDDDYAKSLTSPNFVYDEDLLYMLRSATMDSRVVLDVGANIGYTSVMMSKFNPKLTIHAFEPVMSNVKLLNRNLRDNTIKNVTVHTFGLSDTKVDARAAWAAFNRGSAFVTDDEHEFYPESESISLRMLDDTWSELGLKRCDFIKVDIEGHELKFFAGAKKTLHTYKPTIVMEANHWCLNALQRIPMPDFVEAVTSLFPYVHAFHEGQTIDIREHSEIFMHENIVYNRMMNLLCSFDEKQHETILTRYRSEYAKKTESEDALRQLQEEVAIRDAHIKLIEQELARQPGVKESLSRLDTAVKKRLRKHITGR